MKRNFERGQPVRVWSERVGAWTKASYLKGFTDPYTKKYNHEVDLLHISFGSSYGHIVYDDCICHDLEPGDTAHYHNEDGIVVQKTFISHGSSKEVAYMFTDATYVGALGITLPEQAVIIDPHADLKRVYEEGAKIEVMAPPVDGTNVIQNGS